MYPQLIILLTLRRSKSSHKILAYEQYEMPGTVRISKMDARYEWRKTVASAAR